MVSIWPFSPRLCSPFYLFMLIPLWHFLLILLSSSTNTNDYPEPWHHIRDTEGNHVYLFDTSEECKSYFIKHNIPPEMIKIVNVCDSNCCSYMEEHGITHTHHCQEDCSAADATTAATTSSSTAATTTTTDATAPSLECEKAAEKGYHPDIYEDRPLWWVWFFAFCPPFIKSQSHS